MCGITGWVDWERDLRNEHATTTSMTSSLHRRGPDAEGLWTSSTAALGHRRLAVIDVEGGVQPMHLRTRAGRHIVLVYTGETYNYRELRGKLRHLGHDFRTRSDTEVVLHAYQEWGPACVERMIGMFAFALWDSRNSELFLARDRLGIKPLYYFPYASGLLFGSEPKAILSNPLFTPEITGEGLLQLFYDWVRPPGLTPLNGLYELPPGHYARVTPQGVRLTRYWRLNSVPHTDTLEATISHTRELLSEAVSSQLTADVPLCALLSGGIDSSAIAALASGRLPREQGPLLATYALDFAEQDSTLLRPSRDAPAAAKVAAHLGTTHTTLTVDPAELHDAAIEALRARDLPSMAGFDASLYLLFHRVRANHTVALSGEAADEVFGGYPWYHGRSAVMPATFPWLPSTWRMADCLSDTLQRSLKPHETERDWFSQALRDVPTLADETPEEATARALRHIDLTWSMPVLLDRKDRMSMATGLEVRVPFCDHRLVEYVWNTPWHMKTANGQPKALLRSAVSDLLPADIVNRPKSAYPVHSPRSEHKHQEARLKAMLDDCHSPLRDLLDPRATWSTVNNPELGPQAITSAQRIARLLSIDTWMREYNVDIAI
ncbi:asparagine synthase (glutamine-hydrolyzing) [Streptomyces sp. NPDC004787]|uniref:asparagine synthase (glutamine-hydrolyzing) n=1 Tax=Streptomyces sp. NPDC004787 TaxID=3154291 RepID=UPI0033B4CB4C